MGLASKFNKGGIDWEVDTKDLKFKKTSEVEIGKQYDFLGCYISKDNGYGEGAVIISKDFQLNAPGYFIDTVRDREHRGRGPLKLVALANAVSIINPLMQVTEVTDTVAEMAVRDVEVFRDEDRHIFIRKLHTDEEFLEVEKKSYIYQAMGQTAWGDMAFGNQFAYNDFTNVEKKSLKNYKPLCCIIYKRKKWYIYQNQNLFYMCRSAHQGQEVYDLKLENDQKRFYMNFVLDLTDSCIENEFKFETYEMYDLIVNYKRKFRL